MNLAGVARGRVRMARNTLLRKGPVAAGRARHPLVGLVLTLGLGVLIYASLRGVFGWLAQNGVAAEGASVVLGLVLGAGLVGLLVFDLQEAITVLLLDSDLELLRRAPLSATQVFFLKLADAFLRTSTLIVVFLLPAVLAYSAAYPLPGWAWALVPVQLAGLWAIPLGLGVAAALLVVSRLPVRRAREGLALLSTFTLLVLWLANSFLLPRLEDSGEGIPPAVGRLLVSPPRPITLLPSSWAAHALAAAARGDLAAVGPPTIGLVLAGTLALGLAAVTARARLEDAQARVAVPVGRRRARGHAPATARVPPSSAFRAILRRDARLLFRNWTALSDVLTASVLWTLLPLVSLPHRASSAPATVLVLITTLAVALGYEVAARAVPFEREGGAWRQLAPVSARRWAAAKLAGAALLALPILATASVTLALAFRIGAWGLGRLLCLAVPALGLALTLGLLSGAVFGNPRWTDPRAMLGVSGRLVALLLLAAQAGLWIVVAVVGRALPDVPGLVIPAVLAALLAIAPFRAAVRRLERTEWAG